MTDWKFGDVYESTEQAGWFVMAIGSVKPGAIVLQTLALGTAQDAVDMPYYQGVFDWYFTSGWRLVDEA